MYISIDEYNQSKMAEKVEVNTKYKIMDKKLKHVAILLPEDRWQRMKKVARDPSLWDLRGIRNAFTKETRIKLHVGKDEFLLSYKKVAF